MSVTDFLASCRTVLTWIFGTALPTITSAVVSNGIFLTAVIISLVSTVIFIILRLIMAVIGRKTGGGDD